MSSLLAIVGVEYVLRRLPCGTHQFARFIKPAELIAIAQRAALIARALPEVSHDRLPFGAKV